MVALPLDTRTSTAQGRHKSTQPRQNRRQHLRTDVPPPRSDSLTRVPTTVVWRWQRLRVHYSLLGKQDWWWIFDDSLKEMARQLLIQDFVVVDSFLTHEICLQVKGELKVMYDTGVMERGLLAGGRTGENTKYALGDVRGAFAVRGVVHVRETFSGCWISCRWYRRRWCRSSSCPRVLSLPSLCCWSSSCPAVLLLLVRFRLPPSVVAVFRARPPSSCAAALLPSFLWRGSLPTNGWLPAPQSFRPRVCRRACCSRRRRSSVIVLLSRPDRRLRHVGRRPWRWSDAPTHVPAASGHLRVRDERFSARAQNHHEPQRGHVHVLPGPRRALHAALRQPQPERAQAHCPAVSQRGLGHRPRGRAADLPPTTFRLVHQSCAGTAGRCVVCGCGRVCVHACAEADGWMWCASAFPIPVHVYMCR
jgi:hypothetical protein